MIMGDNNSNNPTNPRFLTEPKFKKKKRTLHKHLKNQGQKQKMANVIYVSFSNIILYMTESNLKLQRKERHICDLVRQVK